jgi:putative transposase
LGNGDAVSLKIGYYAGQTKNRIGVGSMIQALIRSLKRFASRVKQHLKRWSKPAIGRIMVGSLSDLKRSRKDLIIENAILGQQLIVLNRQVKRPQLTQGDRVRFVLLARLTECWQQALHIIQPDTLLRWHRDLFHRYWRCKSKLEKREPRTSPETIELIQQMARENRLWGAERIRGELLKLGVKVSKRTIQKYMLKERRSRSGQNWSTFLKNHFRDIWACDFTVVNDLLFRSWYVFVIMELHTRRIVHTAVTSFPTDEWVAQQLREATPWGEGPKYLIRDRDSKYGEQFAAVASGIEILKTPVRAPRGNSYCERLIGSLRRECLDHMLILDHRQLDRIVQEYRYYYNHSRPHQGIGQQIPGSLEKDNPWPTRKSRGKITSLPVLSGLHHSYARAAVSSY